MALVHTLRFGSKCALGDLPAASQPLIAMSKTWLSALSPETHIATSALNDQKLFTPAASNKFGVEPPLKRDVPPLDHLQLNKHLKEKLGHQFEISGHFQEKGKFSSLVFSVNGAQFYARSSTLQPTVTATSPHKVVLAHKDVPDHGAFPLARVKPGEKLADKNQIFDLPTLRPFPLLKVERAQNLVESFIAAAQTSPRIADLLEELGQGSTKIILATSGRPYQDKSLGDPASPTVYVNGPVDVEPTFVPSTTGMGGHFTVMPKVKDGVTLYMPHSDSGYSPERIDFALNLLKQALSGQRLNPQAAAQGLNAALNTPAN